MSETTEASTGHQAAQATGLPAKDMEAKSNAVIGYVLMGIGLLTGVFWIVGAIWAMLKKGEARDTKFEDHYSNIIRTFWWSFGLSILGVVTAIFIFGYFILMGVWFWSIYKIVKGLAQITSNKAYNE